MQRNRSPGGERVEASRLKAAVFLAALAAYYAVYYVVFTLQVGKYFRDILRHFEFVRRFF